MKSKKQSILLFLILIIIIGIVIGHLITGLWVVWIGLFATIVGLYLLADFIGSRFPNSKIGKFCERILKRISELLEDIIGWV